MYTARELEAILRPHAQTRGVPLGLLMGIARKESSFDLWAYRCEPAYRYLWDNKKNAPFRKLTDPERASEKAPPDFTAIGPVSRDTEWWGQQMSFGLFQLMGAVGRELGFRQPFLTAMLDPSVNIPLACHLLIRLKGRFGSWPEAISAYNAGTPTAANQAYVDGVLAFSAEYGFKP